MKNHMDYTSCRVMFTKGQKEVIDYYLASGYRKSLITSSNILATGVHTNGLYSCKPVADFQVEEFTHCSNTGVEFLDQSLGSSDMQYNWYFEGGEPFYSEDKNPVIQYSEPGKYHAKLVVKTASGQDSLVKENIVMIYSETGKSIAYRQNFEDAGFADDYWYLQEKQGNVGWQRSNISAYEGNYSLYLNNYNSVSENQEYYFVTPPMDLRGVSSPALYFKYAHARKNSDSKDILRLYVSKNCGVSWSLRSIINHVNLPTTNQNYSSQFSPQNQSLWKDYVLDLSNYSNEKKYSR
jgi:PKD repeat protein